VLEIIWEIIGFIAYGTGELVLYAATLGRRKPKLPYQRKESIITRELVTVSSTGIGIIFWGGVLALIGWLVSR
jgi:hypothetical protein